MTRTSTERWENLRLPDKYEIQEVLGEGGFGVVYRVYNRDMDRTEALKVVRFDHARLPAEKLKRDFLREARIMDALARRCRYIVRVYELGPLKATVPDLEAGYFTMEFIPGVSLKEAVLSRGPLPLDRALGLASQVCRALEIAHNHRYRDQVGVLHRDLKLENALLVDSNEGEQIRLLDFGLSKPAAETGSSQTVTVGAVATLGCAPPEQLGTKALGPPADLYSFGVMLYELVSGHEPWLGNPLPRRISESEAWDLFGTGVEPVPVPLSSFTGLLDDPRLPEFESMLHRCLRFRPEDRIQTATGLAEAIRALTGDSSRGGRVGELYDDAVKSMEGRSWKEAIQGFEAIVEWDPGYHDVRTRLREARRRLRVETLYAEARSESGAGNWDAVVDAFSRIHELDPDHRDPEGLLKTARRELKAAERRRRIAALFGEALESMAAERWTDAVKRLDELAQLDPDNPEAAAKLAEATRQKRLAELYDQAGIRHDDEDWSGVVTLFKRIHSAEPEYPDPQGLLETARAAIQTAARDRRLRELYDRALTSLDDQAWTDAIDALESIVELDPTYRDAALKLARATRRHRLAELYEEARRKRDNEDWASVEEILTRLRSTEPTYPDPEGLLEAARRGLAEADRQHRLSELYDQAVDAEDRSEWPKAIESFETIVDLDPTYRDASDRLAHTARQKRLSDLYGEARRRRDSEDWEGATDALTRLHDTEPNYPDPEGLASAVRDALETERERGRLEELYTEGLTALRSGVWGAATTAFEAVLATDPEFRDTADRLKEAQRGARAEATYELARERAADGDWAGVMEALDELERVDTDHPDPDGLLAAAREALQTQPLGTPETASTIPADPEPATDVYASTEPRAAQSGLFHPLLELVADRRLLVAAIFASLLGAASLLWFLAQPSPLSRSSAASSVVIDGPAEMLVGDSITLRLAGGEESGSGQGPVAWRSSDEGVAHVDERGLVFGVREGETVVSVTVGGTTLSHSIVVRGGEVAGGNDDAIDALSIEPPPDPIAVHQRVGLRASATMASGQTRPLEGGEWASSNPAVARIDSMGSLEAVSPGTAVITASAGDRSVSLTIRVVQPPEPPTEAQVEEAEPTRITISGPEGVRIGETIRLEVRLSGGTPDGPVQWTLDPGGLIEVGALGPGGGFAELRGIAPGEVDVVARAGEAEATRRVTAAGYLLSAIRLADIDGPLVPGQTVELDVAAEVGDFGTPPSDPDVTCSSSDDAVVRVDPACRRITAVAAGTATITAESGSLSDDISVNVTAPQPEAEPGLTPEQIGELLADGIDRCIAAIESRDPDRILSLLAPSEERDNLVDLIDNRGFAVDGRQISASTESGDTEAFRNALIRVSWGSFVTPQGERTLALRGRAIGRGSVWRFDTCSLVP